MKHKTISARRALTEPERLAPHRNGDFLIGISISSTLAAVPGNKAAAVEAFRQLGEVAGDAMGHALTLIDGLAVVGGGISGAWPLFLPALVNELNGTYTAPTGEKFRRLDSPVFNLEDPAQLQQFLQGERREITVPGSRKKLQYDPLQRTGVGLSRLGTSEATAIGAYAFALQALDQR